VDYSSGVVRVQRGFDVGRDADLRRDRYLLAVHVQLHAGVDVQRFARARKTESRQSLRHLFTVWRPRCRGGKIGPELKGAVLSIVGVVVLAAGFLLTRLAGTVSW